MVGAAAMAGCQTDTGNAGCQLAQQVVYPGDDLTLLHAARLDLVRDAFVLGGADTSALRWAGIDGSTGELGPPRAAPLDPTSDGIWFAMAGVAAPGDTMLCAIAKPAANGADEQIHVVPWMADGSAAHLRSVLKDTPLVDALVAAWDGGAVLAASAQAATALCERASVQ